MTQHLHHLTGCAPAPLAHYLKALGVLRLVSEQKDPLARGWWQDEHFCLLTVLDREEMEAFFLEAYAPTPFVSPWNRGSGFYASRDSGLGPVERSTAGRFATFRHGIAAGRAPLAALADADAVVRALKDRTKVRAGMTTTEKAAATALKSDASFRKELAAAERRFKVLKGDLLAACALSWRGPHRAWLDAAVVLLEDGRPVWPALFGTGGTDGHLDFTNNFTFRLAQLFDMTSDDGDALPHAGELLRQALWATASCTLTAGAAIGQFLPGAAGGANSTTAPDGESLINPWDFVLMLEGAILFSARSTRRLDPAAAARASAPFAVRAHVAGSGTAGLESASRGEQWMPVWSRPAGLLELQAMLGEARLQLGRALAFRPLDVARAVTRLGAARGIEKFTRFGYLERNGQSNIAVPLGTVAVVERPRSRLIDDIATWAERLGRFARADHATARSVIGEKGLADAIFNVLTHDDEPGRWQAVLLAAVEIEAMQASGTAFEAGPIPPLSPEWIAATNDGTPEWRLACALGSAAGTYDRRGRPADPVRHHWLPLEPGARRFKKADRRIARDARVVMGGRDPAGDFCAVVERRLVEAAQEGVRQLPLVSASGCEADLVDLARVIAGEVDLVRVSGLGRALMAVRWHAWRGGIAGAGAGPWPDEAWAALRLATVPWEVGDSRIPVDEAMVRRLAAGDAATAAQAALRRLRAAGLRPPLQGACADAATARLWAAALVFPISRKSTAVLARPFQPSQAKEKR